MTDGATLSRELCEVLRRQRREIGREYARRLRTEVGPHYSQRPPEELEETTRQAVASYLGVLCADDWGPMDAFIREIARRRFPQRFPMSEVQQAFTLFRDICHPLITGEISGEGLDVALARLDRAVDRTINHFSDHYQSLHLEEIQATSAELEEANRRLRDQYQEVAEAARIKSQFFANMSHELRSPMNSVIGYAELLLDGVDGPLTEEQQQDVRRILDGSRQLLKLINNILDLSRIEAGRMEVAPAPFDVRRLVSEVVDTVAPLAYRKQIHLQQHISDEVGTFVSDAEKIRQILLNLLSNAVKFTEQGEVVVGVERNEEWLEFTVRDTGIGIAEEDREKIFSKFYQVDSAQTRERKGTGLGLSVSRMLVELLGGSVRVESETGRGSTFSFSVPSARAQDDRERREGDAAESVRVLVVEDDSAERELISRMLAVAGAEVESAPDGSGVVEAARRWHPDVITLDLLMPRVDGWEAMEKLQADPLTRTIPIVIISCMERRQKALRMGASAFLVKPLDRAELVETVWRLTHKVTDGTKP